MCLNYKTFVFDCDGVILNSNTIKTEAFYKVALPYGENAAVKFKDYHVKNTGKSRYEKFDYFIGRIIGRQPKPGEIECLLYSFKQEVKNGLMNCKVAPGLDDLRTLTMRSSWMVVSGGDQSELREIFLARDLTIYFNAGIYGSPDKKDIILKRELSKNNLHLPALFLGDSIYDYEVAVRAGLDFIFVSSWSEFKDGEKYFSNIKVAVINSLADLLLIGKWQE